MAAEVYCRGIEQALAPGRFFLAAGELAIRHLPSENRRWEVYRGHLLDPAFTREEQTFESWLIHFPQPEYPAGQPILAIHWDAAHETIHLTRSILVFGREAYQTDSGIIDSRPARKWLTELVGSIDLGSDEAGDWRQQLEWLLFQAAIGTSRLPITSLESPLPAFALGLFGYFPIFQPGDRPLRSAAELVEQGARLSSDPEPAVATKMLELALRSANEGELAPLARTTLTRWGEERLVYHARDLFRRLALAAGPDLAARLATFLLALADAGPDWPVKIAGILAYMLRLLCRHLAAYDLVTFHNRGANYPDALALDCWLKALVKLAAAHPACLEAPLCRRALRQGWIARKLCQGLPVPDRPVSPGENLRVLPEPYGSLPEDQLFKPAARRKRLFASQLPEELTAVFGRRWLDRSLADLDEEEELCELGMATFLDRPFGVLKLPGEVDRTPLVPYQAFSRSLALDRLAALRDGGEIDGTRHEALRIRLLAIEAAGVPVRDYPGESRRGVVGLEDAAKVRGDFVFLSSKPLPDLVSKHLGRLPGGGQVRLLIRGPRPAQPQDQIWIAYDELLRPRAAYARAGCDPGTSPYVAAGGNQEWLRGGLLQVQIWE